jgi:hypothetical protein
MSRGFSSGRSNEVLSDFKCSRQALVVEKIPLRASVVFLQPGQGAGHHQRMIQKIVCLGIPWTLW